MALTVNTNIASLTAQRNLTGSQGELSTSLQRLSSGLRINSAKDDAAGLAISERFTAQIRGLQQGVRNANDGVSLSQTAEGALQQVTANLQRMRELAVQSANATNSSSDRNALQAEVSQLVAEIDRVAANANFNGVKLLDGTFQNKSFQIGPNASDVVSISAISSARTSSLGVVTSATYTGGDVTTNAIAAGDITINGIAVGASDSDAKSVAAAINLAQNQVAATANSLTVAGSAMTGAATTGTVTINGTTTASITTSTDEASSRALVIAAVNAISAQTGVTASDTGSVVNLTAADGRNVVISYGGTTTNAATGLANTGTYESTVTLTSDSTFTIGGTAPTDAGLAANTYNAAAGGTAISSITVANASDATTAIASIDGALAQINSSRATLGAFQSRFESVIQSQQISAENLSSARSRIVDADFASETASLTKAQILQQSGIAMLAQANAIPQNVLALLQ
jgi:flagellin